MKKAHKILTGFLGISMFMFGMLKFVNPFKGWYSVQVQMSALPLQSLSYWAGQLGEILVGAAFIVLAFSCLVQKSRVKNLISVYGNLLIVVMMLAAFYVHMHPDVPASVLPLKIRPPAIPAVFLVLAVVNIYAGRKSLQK
ncbi:hypothetical protein [Ekhidna sp.]|uniref:hypothetical protein n=1 Tax=Ekhidna sp. TaxID=2608089 RepID=UPI003C7AF7E3